MGAGRGKQRRSNASATGEATNAELKELLEQLTADFRPDQMALLDDFAEYTEASKKAARDNSGLTQYEPFLTPQQLKIARGEDREYEQRQRQELRLRMAAQISGYDEEQTARIHRGVRELSTS